MTITKILTDKGDRWGGCGGGTRGHGDPKGPAKLAPSCFLMANTLATLKGTETRAHHGNKVLAMSVCCAMWESYLQDGGPGVDPLATRTLCLGWCLVLQWSYSLCFQEVQSTDW